jgi:hypothetical protein
MKNNTQKYIITYIILLLCGIIYGQKNYLYGNLVKISNDEINILTVDQIDLMIYNLSERVKIFEELKNNLTEINLFDVANRFILNNEFYNNIKFVENTVENKKTLDKNYEIDNFDFTISSFQPIIMLSNKINNINNINNVNNINNDGYNKELENNYFDYFEYRKMLFAKLLDDNFQNKFKLKIYNVRKSLENIIKKINWYREELKKYNPDIHKNYINSITNLYKKRYYMINNIVNDKDL